jgi:hypothetical protein
VWLSTLCKPGSKIPHSVLCWDKREKDQGQHKTPQKKASSPGNKGKSNKISDAFFS